MAGTGTTGMGLLSSWLDDAHNAIDIVAEPALETAAAFWNGPEAVPFFLDRLAVTRSRLRGIAGPWLASHTQAVLDSEVPPRLAPELDAVLRAVEASTLEAALPVMRGLVRRVAERIAEDRRLPVLGTQDHPLPAAWPDHAAGKPARAPWFSVGGLPPLVLGEGRLPADRVEAVIAELQTSSRASAGSLAGAVREHVTPASRDAFATGLLIAWQAASGMEKWVLPAVGSLGADDTADRLAADIRQWPQLGFARRAGEGVLALGAIGTDRALRHLTDLALSLRQAGLRKKAVEALENVRWRRGLTDREFEDRSAPQLGLDDRGLLELRTGISSYLIGISPEAKPVVRERGPDGSPSGKARASLPKAPAYENPQDVAAARKEFSALKKRFATVGGEQIERFSRAMIRQDRWSAEEHQAWIGEHPLLRSLLVGIVWSITDNADQMRSTARLDEDGRLLDLAGEPVILEEGEHLHVLHPASVDEDIRRSWIEELGRRRLKQAFPQLEDPFGLAGLEAGS